MLHMSAFAFRAFEYQTTYIGCGIARFGKRLRAVHLIAISTLRRRATSTFQFYVIRKFRDRVSEMEVQEIIHVEVLRCLVKLNGLGYSQIDQDSHPGHSSGVRTLWNS